jgi:hypothetical protein
MNVTAPEKTNTIFFDLDMNQQRCSLSACVNYKELKLNCIIHSFWKSVNNTKVFGENVKFAADKISTLLK